MTHDKVHFDLSGPFFPILGINFYDTHLFEPRTGKSDICQIKLKSELQGIVLN